ncbi:MAG: fatty acyl-AMP ligase [Blastocatellia bacterium]|nr:fatty acyl-AMP ligase [Blastocatellia bacterium]
MNQKNESLGRCNFQNTLVALLQQKAEEHAEKVLYTFLADGEIEADKLTYGELALKSRAIAAVLQEQNAAGERALLVFPPGNDYIAAFFGCLYAGVIAVPVYPPGINQSLSRLQAIAFDARAKIALTTSDIVAQINSSQIKEAAAIKWIATDIISTEVASNWKLPSIDAETLAFLQYTSGSTSTPKGVMVTHGNLLHNQSLIKEAFGHSEKSVVAGWLPLYHDMGLIGNVLQPLYVGATCVLMSPISFLQKPLRWLKAISSYKATTSGGPNFSYELCVKKISEQDRQTLDLSSWQIAFNGAEPIRYETIERFAKAFAPSGFSKKAFFPCYGLAEATLFVTGNSYSPESGLRFVEKQPFENNLLIETLQNEDSYRLVGSGKLATKILIVDPESRRVSSPNMVGEVWISGESVAKGYWKQEKETEETFRAFTEDTKEGPFLRTGDLGFLRDGELFVTGRIKDLIINLNTSSSHFHRLIQLLHFFFSYFPNI